MEAKEASADFLAVGLFPIDCHLFPTGTLVFDEQGAGFLWRAVSHKEAGTGPQSNLQRLVFALPLIFMDKKI